MISVIISEIRDRIDEFTDLNLNIAEFYDTFQNYFVDVFSISNVLNFRSCSSELSDVQMTNNDDASAAAVTENSESATDIMRFTAISVSDDMKMTSVKQMTD